MSPLELQLQVATVRANLDHHRTMSRRLGKFADTRLQLIDAIRKDRDAGDIDADASAVQIATADRERAEYLDHQAEHRRLADAFEERLVALLRELAATVEA